MATPPKANIEGLIRLLSSEAQPKYPDLRREDWFVSLEKWIKELTLYLEKIFGKFTATNIIQTIFTGGGTGVEFTFEKAFDYKGTNLVNTTLDNTHDWRGRAIIFSITTSITSAAAVVSNPDYFKQGVFSPLDPLIGGYPMPITTFTDGGVTSSIDLQSDGSIKYSIGGGASHRGWISISLAAIGRPEPVTASYEVIGNRL